MEPHTLLLDLDAEFAVKKMEIQFGLISEGLGSLKMLSANAQQT